MPSPIGHALAGLAIGLVAQPSAELEPPVERPAPLAFVVVGAIVAALPDADLLYPGIHRGVSHSIGATLFVMIIASVVTGWVTGRVRWRWVFLVGAAHGSHILMDWLGVDRYEPPGLEALWPFSHRFYISGWDIFPSTERRLWLPNALWIDLRAVTVEIAIMGPIAGLAWIATRKRRNRGRTSVRDTLPRPSV